MQTLKPESQTQIISRNLNPNPSRQILQLKPQPETDVKPKPEVIHTHAYTREAGPTPEFARCKP